MHDAGGGSAGRGGGCLVGRRRGGNLLGRGRGQGEQRSGGEQTLLAGSTATWRLN